MTAPTIIRSEPFYKGVCADFQSPVRGSGRLTYTPGAIVEADGLDQDPHKACGQGIHFCRSLAEALRWGPVAVRIGIPEGEVVVDAGDKLRARRVLVGDVVNLQAADLSYAHLSGANLSGAHLSGANLSGAHLSGAHLRGANLRGAHLSDANLNGADLRGAHLSDAHLSYAHLSYAHLNDANLSGADLRGASLRGADLRGADLSCADLRGADLRGANPRGAIGNKYTSLPAGWKVENRKVVKA